MVKDYVNRNGAFQVFASECGHLPVSVNTTEELEFEFYVKRQMGLKPDSYVSIEYYIAGLGMVWMFKFLCEKNGVPIPEGKIDGKRVFDLLQKEHPLYEKFRDIYLKYLGKLMESVTKIYLNEGGTLVLGGIIFHFFKKFFQLSTDKFFKKLLRYFYRNDLFKSVYQSVSISIFPNDVSEFSIIGCENRILLD